MKKNNIVLIVITIVTLLTLIIGATYAYFATGNLNITNVVNANTITEQNNMVFDTLGGGMILDITAANMVQAKQGNVAAENNTTLTVNFTPNTDYSMVCTYDIVYEWTSTNKYTTHSPGVTENEFTIQARLDYNPNVSEGINRIHEEKDLVNVVGNNNSTTVISGAEISGIGSTTSTAEWNITSFFYNVVANQNALAGKTFSGKFKVDNVSCVAGNTDRMLRRGRICYDYDENCDDSPRELEGNYDDELLGYDRLYGHDLDGINTGEITAIFTVDHINVPNNAVDSWDISDAQNGSVMAWLVTNSSNKYDLYLGQEGGVKAHPDSSWTFAEFTGAKTIDLTHFYTKNVYSMEGIFGCMDYCNGALTSLDLGNHFDTSAVVNMYDMFYEVNSLENLDLGNLFDTSNVSNMSDIFAYMESLTSLDLGNHFDTSNVLNMSSMFIHMESLTSLDLGNLFDTSNVLRMSLMFAGMKSLTSLDLGNHFDTSNVSDMSYMFMHMESLTSLDLGNLFDTSKVTSMSSMFLSMNSLTSLDLGPNFNTSNVTSMSQMFSGDSNLTKIYVPSSWSVAKLTSQYSSSSMFKNCLSLSGAISYNANIVDKTYANYTNGYLTLRNS